MIVKVVQELGEEWREIGKVQEMFIKDLEELNNRQTEMSDTLKGINSKITEAEWINDLEDRLMEITARTEYRKKDEKK